LVALHAARLSVAGADVADVAWCRQRLTWPAAELDPPPLLTGDDLLRHGVPAGPLYRRLLSRLRDAQLDGQVTNRDEALGLVERLRAADGDA
jgi:hypothetical protein